MSDTKRAALSREDLEEQLKASEEDAKKNYDAYQQSLGVVAACKHMLTRFDVPARVKEEPKPLEEVK
jgi:hypothetical protein